MKAQSHAVPSRKPSPSIVGITAAAVGGVAALASIASVVAVGAVARMVVTPAKQRQRDTEVLSLNRRRKTITLRATPDTILPGRYGMWFGQPERYLKLGPVLWRDRTSVTRRLESDEIGLPLHGRATFSGWYYQHPRELGLESESVRIQTPIGAAPAWLVPAENPRDTWVILVHGRGVGRGEPVRAVPVLRDAGFTTLNVSYRNDGDAPRSADGRYGLGATEWEDVDAAIDYALAAGARDVILMGWSMGGAISLQVALQGRNRDAVRGIILESPVTDWNRVLVFQAEAESIPPIVRHGALAALGNPWGRRLTGLDAPLDLPSLDIVARSSELSVPILILHSDDDGFVPSSGSHALADARPDLVTLDIFQVARHTKLWNYDPDRWNRSIAGWLDKNFPRGA